MTGNVVSSSRWHGAWFAFLNPPIIEEQNVKFTAAYELQLAEDMVLEVSIKSLTSSVLEIPGIPVTGTLSTTLVDVNWYRSSYE